MSERLPDIDQEFAKMELLDKIKRREFKARLLRAAEIAEQRICGCGKFIAEDIRSEAAKIEGE